MFARFPKTDGTKVDVNPANVSAFWPNPVTDGAEKTTTIVGNGLSITVAASDQAVRGGLKRALAAQTGVADKDPSEV
jgi:hypothetical protein